MAFLTKGLRISLKDTRKDEKVEIEDPSLAKLLERAEEDTLLQKAELEEAEEEDNDLPAEEKDMLAAEAVEEQQSGKKKDKVMEFYYEGGI